MAHLVVLVLDNPEQSPSVLQAWRETGVSGVTILESAGLGRLLRGARDDLPLIPALKDILASRELHHRTLFTVVEDDETVDEMIAATERIVGDLLRPHTGLLFVVPVTRALGLRKKGDEGE